MGLKIGCFLLGRKLCGFLGGTVMENSCKERDVLKEIVYGLRAKKILIMALEGQMAGNFRILPA